MDLKIRLVQDYQNELKGKDDEYVKEIKRQSTEVDCLLERMNTQRHEIRVALAQELDQIEQAFMQERNDLLGKFLGETDQLMESRRGLEAKFLETNMGRVEDHIKSLQDLRVHDTEDYNLTKIKLETDVQVLEQQLQQMRATYQLNSEKLEYNFQVLKKRDEENNVTITTQKRKINRLNDYVNGLRAKLQKQEEGYHKEYHQLSDDYKRIMEQFTELQKKFRRFQAMDNKKYQDLWEMNEEEALELLRKIVTADRVFWEQQLGSSWVYPEHLKQLLDWGHSSGQQNVTGSQTNLALSPLDDISSSSPSAGSEVAAVKSSSARAMSSAFTEQQLLQLMSAPTTRQILDLLTSEASSFLVEEKLHKLLASLSREEQNLMKLDSIFKALNIQSVQDVERLQSYFVADNNASKSTEEEKADLALIHPNEVIRSIRKFVEDSKNLTSADGTRRVNHSQQQQQQQQKKLDDDEEHRFDEEDGIIFQQHQQHLESAEEQKFAFWHALADAIDPKQFHVWDVC